MGYSLQVGSLETAATGRSVSLKTLLDIDRRYDFARSLANCGLWDWDFVAGRIACCPQTRQMLHLKGNRIEGGLNGWLNRVAFEDRPRFKQDILDHLEGRTSRLCGEYRLTGAPRAPRWVLIRALALRDSEKKVRRVLGLLTDISAVRDDLPHRALSA